MYSKAAKTRTTFLFQKALSEYLQDPKIANDFAIYYELFNKYKSDYHIDEILSGKASITCKRVRFLSIITNALAL